jgi:hypothetical protein
MPVYSVNCHYYLQREKVSYMEKWDKRGNARVRYRIDTGIY